jgi:hypothetical protein
VRRASDRVRLAIGDAFVAIVYGVYPRERGGTDTSQGLLVAQSGLSPRARGNGDAVRPDEQIWGSIPASAGNDGLWQCRVSRSGSIPTSAGNVTERLVSRLVWGSIPASAGERRRHTRPA